MKILKNKRGYSLLELMASVTIVGVLSAVAIPSYLSYKETARQGVVASMLHLVDRTMNIEVMIGQSLANLKSNVGGRIWNKIQSNEKSSFDAPTMKLSATDNTQWCFAIDGSGGDYREYSGCVSNNTRTPAKVVRVGGAGLTALAFVT